MDHVVYLEAKANELENLLSGKKRMIIRGAAGRKLPYGRVSENDTLYLINNNGEGEIRATAKVKSVFNSEKLSEQESIELVKKYQKNLFLTDKQFNKWAGKRYIVLIELEKVKEIKPFKIDKSNFSNMDDWLSVEQINNVKIS